MYGRSFGLENSIQPELCLRAICIILAQTTSRPEIVLQYRMSAIAWVGGSRSGTRLHRLPHAENQRVEKKKERKKKNGIVNSC